jgi:uncharacterized membrane protein YkoI
MQTWHMTALALTMMVGVATPIIAQTTTPAMTTPAMTTPPQDLRAGPDVKCWTDWSEAASIVRRETLMPVERVSQLAAAKYPGANIIKVTLCEEHGKFVYHVLLRERQGQLKSELLDAR